MPKTMNLPHQDRDKLYNMFFLDDTRNEWSPEGRLWASVLLKMYEDSNYARQAVDNFYNELSAYTELSNFYDLEATKEAFRNLTSWEHERQKLMRELQSDWLRDVCNLINFDFSKFNKKLSEILRVSSSIEGRILYWRTGFSTKIQPITNEVTKNGIKRKKEDGLWERV